MNIEHPLMKLERLIPILLGAVFLGIFGGTMWAAWNAVKVGAIGVAADISAFANSVAMFGLVLITGVYAYSTWRLVEETKNNRDQEKQIREREKKEHKENLRIALYAEISYIHNWAIESIEENSFKMAHTQYTTRVYDNNASEISQLTGKEAQYVTNFYNVAITIDKILEIRREARNPLEQAVMVNVVLLDELGEAARTEIEENLPEDAIVAGLGV